MDILYQINISQYGKVDSSEPLKHIGKICPLKFQFEHQKNGLLGQMMDLFLKVLIKMIY